MSSSVVNNPSPSSIGQLLAKLSEHDSDLRFMSLNDLNQILTGQKSEFLRTDYNTASRITDAVINALDDQNGEVQNMAVKWCEYDPSLECLEPLSTDVIIFPEQYKSTGLQGPTFRRCAAP